MMFSVDYDEVKLLKETNVGEIKHYPNGGLLAELVSPYRVPEILGWNRIKAKSGSISYDSPFRAKLKSWRKIAEHLMEIGSKLSIDQFTFDEQLDTSLAINEVKPEHIVTDDVTNGLELFPIRCVNQVNDERLDTNFTYSSQRVPRGDVKIFTEFRSCCDCNDGCISDRCPCRRLTCEDFKNDPIHNHDETERRFGYEGRRLPFVFLTGVYECTDNKRCKLNCQNRLIQNGISIKLEVFMTDTKGWGVRCLHDLPDHTFVCLYSGEILTSRDAERIGMKDGDEYLTLLNHVEIIEEKAGYEDSLVSSDLSTDSVEDLEPSNKRQKVNHSSKWRSDDKLHVRDYFKDKLDCEFEPFVIDAKRVGNVGRFLNHSCDPNCVLTPIYVDTHDPRLPWMAFFTKGFVKSNTELTWDYLYKEGDEQFEHCRCGADNCRSKDIDSSRDINSGEDISSSKGISSNEDSDDDGT